MSLKLKLEDFKIEVFEDWWDYDWIIMRIKYFTIHMLGGISTNLLTWFALFILFLTTLQMNVYNKLNNFLLMNKTCNNHCSVNFIL
jgi:hypothetical protein